MPATIYYEKDADLAALKNKTIAIIGYGSQGHAQAQNLRDSGLNVIIGQRPGSPNYDLAVSHKFTPMSAAEASEKADIVNILLPDEVQGDVYRNDIKPKLKPGNVLMCSHGFNIHFGQVEPPQGVDALLVAPKGPGHLVRSEFEKGGASAAPAAASSKPPSPKKPKPTCSASKWCSAAASAPWSKPATRRSSKRATSLRWPTSSACTS
jgi:ketol-acid reductoisomerase